MDWSSLWQSTASELVTGSRQVSDTFVDIPQSLGSRGSELESHVSQYSVSYRMRVLLERNETREGFGCGMVFLFLHYLMTEPWAGSSACLSPVNFLFLLLVDMGDGEKGGDNRII